MKKDDKILGIIYESIRFGDIVLIDEPDFGWDGIFESIPHNDLFLLESFEKIKDKEPFDDGVFDAYEIELKNGQKFQVTLSYNNAKRIRDISNKASLEAEHKNQMEIVSGYEPFLNIQDGEYVMMVEFKDSSGRHDDTGNVGIHALELFEMLKQSFIHSVQGGFADKLVGIMMRVDKNNPRRMNFYKTLLKRHISKDFPNIFVDPNTNSARGYDLLVATK
jgi:hypothetical protein